MKNISTIVFVALVAFAITSQGFQCGSPEFSGAKLRIQQKDYKGAIKLLENEVKKNPNNEEAWFLLGELDADQGDFAGMNTAFDQALTINNKHAKEIHNSRYGRWGQHINSGVTDLGRAGSDSAQFYDSAAVQFKTAILIWPDTSLTYKYLGIVYNNKGDNDNALDAFKTAWEKGKDLESLKRMGKIYFTKGTELDTKFETDNADSIRITKNLEAIKKGSYKNDVTSTLGAPDQQKKLQPGKKARKGVTQKSDISEEWRYANYRFTVWMTGDRVDSASLASFPRIDSSYHRQALLYYDSSETIFEKVKEVDPKDNENLAYLLEAYVKSGRITEAIKTFRIAVANDPNNKTNHYILGILLRTDGQFQAAVDEFKTALTLDPSYSDALYDVGATLYNWGVDIIKQADAKGQETTEYKQKFQDALPYLEKVASIKKDDPQVFETLGTIYARVGQQAKATKVFNDADWLRKHYELKLGMKGTDLVAAMGEPTKKEDATYENSPASKWTYDKDSISFVLVDGIVKDWTRTGK